jgi:hypothetical protein
MAADGHGQGLSIIQWAIGGVAILGAGAIGWLHRAIASVRRDDERGREAIWLRVNKQTDEAAAAALRAEQRFASAEDVQQLGDRLERYFDRQLQAQRDVIREIVNSRSPARTQE